MTADTFPARHPVLVFLVLPPILLVILTIGSAAAEIVLDHFVLRRAHDGMPLLYALPWARSAVTAWNLGVVYAAPVLIALWFARLGLAHRVRETWLWSAGLFFCVLGGLHYLETRWTGIKGTSTLLIGPVPDMRMAVLRIGANALIFAACFWLLKKGVTPDSVREPG